MSQATETTLRAALIEAEAGLEFAAAQLPQTTGFVPAHVAALHIVRAALSATAAPAPEAPTLQAVRLYAEAFEDLFAQCCSNPIKNAWGQDVDTTELNAAHAFASRVLAGQEAPQPAAQPMPIELEGVAKERDEGSGHWRPCSGCYELNEGHDTGPFSTVFACALGNGCSECGGIGAIWDTTDYAAMGDAMARSIEAPPPAAQQAPATHAAMCLAYGWLWHATTSDPRVHAARAALLEQLSRDDQRAGIRAARAAGASVDEAALEAALNRGDAL